MPDAFEEQAVLVAAEQAAAEGDAIAAEAQLRRLLDLQSARLGPEHPEVASTLHNLAVVCERAGRISEAEGLYRKAYAIAAAALPPTDQLVVRCQEDLHAFLDARMMPAQAAAPVAAPVQARTPPSGVRKAAAPPVRTRPPSRTRPPAPPAAPPSSSRWIGLAVGGALIAAAAIGWAMFGRAGADSEPAPAPRAAESSTPAARPAPAKKKAPAPTTAPSAAPPAAAAPTSPSEAPIAAAPSAPAPAAAPDPPPAGRAEDASESAATAADPGAITVTDARLCSQLSTSGGWTCTPPEQPVSAGRLHFLTRIAVPQTTELEHRWYHGEALVRSVRLRVPPAGRVGYRTYSRMSIDAARTGAWHVELRGPDGAVLAQDQFVVQ